MKKIMVLDCEYMQPSCKCISIGAAIYDIRSGECYDTLNIFVNPKESISAYITNLTGITDKDVSNAPDIVEAWNTLKEFHKKHDPFRNPLLWGSGVRNDSIALFEEYVKETGSEEENFMGRRVLDAKTLYQSFMLFENKSYAGGLSDCMKCLGLEFEGKPHTAIADARNTFKIWYHLVRKMHDGNKIKK